MVRLLWKTLVFLLSSAVGILVADMLLEDMRLEATGFIVVVVVYSIIQAVVQPFVTKMAALHASAFLGGTALVATLIALLVASLLGGDSMEIDGAVTWIAATVIVWLVTAVASLAIPFLLVKAGVEHLREDDDKKRVR
ncbi:phage holin family protein [Nocardioides sambongensis]|uniref:phage holin family protein n=1 Tax=Nocardioides sambongensis TaxID=2589074 RepID=UPI00112D91A0|nr:phage holin family protein [Nocardioides sambongensis]